MSAAKKRALQVLGLPASATDEQIVEAYGRLRASWHGTTYVPPHGAGSGGSYDEGDDDSYYDEEEDYYSDEDEDIDEDAVWELPPITPGRIDYASFLDEVERMGGGSAAGSGQGPMANCACADCVRARRAEKEATREARQAAARQRRAARDADAAQQRAQEAADKLLQQKDPKSSLAWAKGGESRERLIREHFLAQPPRLVLHEARRSSLVLVLDVPDLSLIEADRLPPAGVEWEVEFCPQGGKKPASLAAPRGYDNLHLPKLTPGTAYSVRVRTGTSGSLTWAGSPEWGPWSAPAVFKTTGEAPAAAAGAAAAAVGGRAGHAGRGGGKKKKNRDAAFAKLTRPDPEPHPEDEPEAGEPQEAPHDEAAAAAAAGGSEAEQEPTPAVGRRPQDSSRAVAWVVREAQAAQAAAAAGSCRPGSGRRSSTSSR